jgi:hypothetical protein
LKKQSTTAAGGSQNREWWREMHPQITRSTQIGRIEEESKGRPNQEAVLAPFLLICVDQRNPRMIFFIADFAIVLRWPVLSHPHQGF